TPLGILRLLLFLVSAVGFGFLRVRGVADIPGLRGLDEIWDLGCRLARRLLWGALAAAVVILAVGIVLRWDDVSVSLQVYSSPVAAGGGRCVGRRLFGPGTRYAARSWSAGSGVGLGGAETSSALRAATVPVPDVPVLQLLSGDYPAWTMAAPAVLIVLGRL